MKINRRDLLVASRSYWFEFRRPFVSELEDELAEFVEMASDELLPVDSLPVPPIRLSNTVCVLGALLT